ncbi:MAG TPA: DUF4290 domain-containing protein [Bacteroidales bacterium]|nr:DUF4290 domain-containing protein [Bacteroidales bacterium]
MEYNSQRPKLIVPEYGRSVQKMAENLLTIEDREQRSRMARTIVNVMALLNTDFKDTPDTRQKLWDHLHLITDFKLDVDSTFPPPSPESLSRKPSPLSYPQESIAFRYYGKNIIRLIENIARMEESPAQENLTRAVANQMKKSYLNWNKDSVTDDIIGEHLKKLSKGKLQLSDSTRLHETSELLMMQRKKKILGKPRPGGNQIKNKGKI